MRPMKSPRLLAFLAVAFAIVFCGAAFAQTRVVPQINTPHNPYTMKGFLVRGELRVPIEEPFGAAIQDMGPVLFQEIAPCTLASTLTADQFAAPWGGPKLNAFENRTFVARGYLSSSDFVNPCSGAIPTDARAIDIRIHALNPDAAGSLALSWGSLAPAAGFRALDYPAAATNAMEEAGVMLDANGSFTLHTTAPTDAVIEVLGYFIADPQKPQPAANPGYYVWYVDGYLGTDGRAECVNAEVPAGSTVVGCNVISVMGASIGASSPLPARGCVGTILNSCLNVEGQPYGNFRVTIVSPNAP